MKYWDLLTECADLAESRDPLYGDATDNWNETLAILNSISVRQFDIQDVMNVMLAVKLSRRKTSPTHHDSDIDLINYLAIGLMFKK